MRTLGPHLQGAHEVAQRLKDTGEARRSLEGALAWLADGVALVRADGTVVYANDALQASARRGDGMRIKHSQIELDAPAARARLTDAIAAAGQRIGGDPMPACDFPAPRPSGSPAYLVSVRPLGKVRHHDGAAAIVFIRDPSAGHGAAPELLRGMFNLTAAEANLAQAIRAGMSLADYARASAVTVNTVYTHLRRLKDKTGCHRMAELIRKLNDVQAAAVARRER